MTIKRVMLGIKCPDGVELPDPFTQVAEAMPCIIEDGDGKEIGLLVDLRRFNELLTNNAIGVCSAHMTALLSTPVDHNARREARKAIRERNKRFVAKKAEEAPTKAPAKAPAKKAAKKKKPAKASKLPRGRRKGG